MVMNKGLAFLA
ncbi:hypothetical protein E2320_016411, partial [Naja naja]